MIKCHPRHYCILSLTYVWDWMGWLKLLWGRTFSCALLKQHDWSMSTCTGNIEFVYVTWWCAVGIASLLWISFGMCCRRRTACHFLALIRLDAFCICVPRAPHHCRKQPGISHKGESLHLRGSFYGFSALCSYKILSHTLHTCAWKAGVFFARKSLTVQPILDGVSYDTEVSWKWKVKVVQIGPIGNKRKCPFELQFSLHKCPKQSWQGFRHLQSQANAHLKLEFFSFNTES